jgi:hypothetical protein
LADSAIRRSDRIRDLKIESIRQDSANTIHYAYRNSAPSIDKSYIVVRPSIRREGRDIRLHSYRSQGLRGQPAIAHHLIEEARNRERGGSGNKVLILNRTS